MSEFKSYNAAVMFNINRPLLLLGVEVHWTIMGFLLVVVGTLLSVFIGIMLLGAMAIGYSLIAKKKKQGYKDYLRSMMSSSGRPVVLINNEVLGMYKIRRS